MNSNFSHITIQKFLVQLLKISNKEALELLINRRIFINNQTAAVHQIIIKTDHIALDSNILKEGESLNYIAFYKPRGIECTLNPEIPDNLTKVINFPTRLFPVGRLDKESEGLLLMTNDGSIYNKILHKDLHQEKEYIVSVDLPLTDEGIEALSEGIIIMGQQTRKARVTRVNENSFNIILTQGLNRQIRRMCYKLGYKVIFLKRIRIINIQLEFLTPGTWRPITEIELKELKSTIE
jgi:23S rRNA pseudouridine2604 synthase